jgi:hypothetical protein
MAADKSGVGTVRRFWGISRIPSTGVRKYPRILTAICPAIDHFLPVMTTGAFYCHNSATISASERPSRREFRAVNSWLEHQLVDGFRAVEFAFKAESFNRFVLVK